jgi:hypothetical protein
MADVIFVAVIVAFFGLAAGLVRACDHIIGPEDSVVSATDQPAREEAAA